MYLCLQVHRLYESGHYEDVVQLLMPTLYQPQPKTKVRGPVSWLE